MVTTIEMAKPKHRIVGAVLVVLICCLGWFIVQSEQQKSHIDYPSEYLTIIEHQRNGSTSKQRKQDIQTLKTIIADTEKRKTEANRLMKQRDALATQKDEKERAVYTAMDHALEVGKFTCKVNTCQGNPEDENYPIFIKATNDLVAAKQALADAKTEYEKASQAETEQSNYEQLLQEMKTTLTQLEEATK